MSPSFSMDRHRPLSNSSYLSSMTITRPDSLRGSSILAGHFIRREVLVVKLILMVQNIIVDQQRSLAGHGMKGN
jgi:hypothetical protein